MSDLAPIMLLLGDAGLLRREAVDAAVSLAFEGRSPGFNMGTYLAGEGAPGALNLARTQPMMARRRVVLIREVENADPPLLDALLEYAANPNPSTVLLLTGLKLPPAVKGTDRGRRLLNLVRKSGSLQKFDARGQRPGPFARARASALGCELDSTAARLLVELAGNDLAQLGSEIDKLVCYVGGAGTIRSSDVEAVCSVVAEAISWDLTDAVVSRNPDRALVAVHRMLEDAGPGEARRLLSLVAWQMRSLLELQSALRARADVPSSWARVPSRKLDAAKNTLRRRPLDPARLLGALADANRRFNRSRAGERRIFESLILDLTAG